MIENRNRFKDYGNQTANFSIIACLLGSNIIPAKGLTIPVDRRMTPKKRSAEWVSTNCRRGGEVAFLDSRYSGKANEAILEGLDKNQNGESSSRMFGYLGLRINLQHVILLVTAHWSFFERT